MKRNGLHRPRSIGQVINFCLKPSICDLFILISNTLSLKKRLPFLTWHFFKNVDVLDSIIAIIVMGRSSLQLQEKNIEKVGETFFC